MPLPPRVPWPDDFPDVIVHGEEKARNAHPGYLAAKSGDARAALKLAMDMLCPHKIDEIGAICSPANAWLLPVSADEASGFNAIPDAMAAMVSRQTSMLLESRENIVQTNKVAHTRSPGFQRIVTPAAFAGSIVKGRRYFLVDDHAGFGGTLASLTGHIVQNGGQVIGCTTLTASPNSATLAVSKLTLDMIHGTYGEEINDFWHATFGHGIDCLTQREAVLVSRQHSLVALQACLAQAAEEVRARGI